MTEQTMEVGLCQSRRCQNTDLSERFSILQEKLDSKFERVISQYVATISVCIYSDTR